MAKVFLGLDDAYRVLSEGATLYGVAGDPDDRVLVEYGASAISVNGNMDRLDFYGNIADFKFKAGFGANMQVYASDGISLLSNISLQDDSDGTQLVFTDGAVNAIYNAGAIGVGGVNITGTISEISPTAINTGVTSGAGVSSNAEVSAKIFLESGDAYREINNNATIYGVAGETTDRVLIESGANNISVNANVDRLDFSGNLSEFKFKAGFGANTMVYAADGTTLIVTIPLQDDANGTQLVFANGSVNAIYSSGAVGVGGVTLTGTASEITPNASEIDTSVTSGVGKTNINVSASNNGETYTALANITENFIISTNASYEYSITGFELGVDIINMPDGTVMDNTALDGMARLEWASDGIIVGVTLLNLTNDEDNQLAQISGMGNSLFTGSGSGTTAETVSADIGAFGSTAEELSASGKSVIFTDDANVENNVTITGFSSDDEIRVSNAVEGNYNFTSDAQDVIITYNNIDHSVTNTIILVGVVTADDIIYNETSFETTIGFDAFSFV